MDPKTVAEALTKISQQYEASCKGRAALEAGIESRSQAILALQKTIAARDREIEELKKQRADDHASLTREIDGWKAKHEKAVAVSKELNAALEEKTKELAAANKYISDTKALLATETKRADDLAAKYDPEIKAAAQAAAEAERKRQIAELEARLNALKNGT